MGFLEQLQKAAQGKMGPEDARILHDFYFTYIDAGESNGYQKEALEALLLKFLSLASEQYRKPFVFKPFHTHIKTPFDYYQFGIEFIRPLVIRHPNEVINPENVDKIASQIARGDNVILLANHQTELDPQAISIALESTHPELAQKLICVAGHRVVSDPMAIPFSMGCNLLCVYSKKHLEHDPDKKAARQLHNQRTMKLMVELLSEGGKLIYVAPSGGRDRPNEKGTLEVAPFDPQSLEMFWLMAQKADHPTHFYPLALSTYDLLPPPGSVDKALGEARTTQATRLTFSFGNEVDMEHFPGSDQKDKKVRRQKRAHHIWKLVSDAYAQQANSG